MTAEDIEIRRLFISNDEWKRTSQSWKDLKPHLKLDRLDPLDETQEAYRIRLADAGFVVPRLVLDQWLYPHYFNRNTVNNYGWLDYTRVSWLETRLTVDELTSLHVISEYRHWVESRARLRAYDEFTCTPHDLEHWKRFGTWRIPPVVLDVSSLRESQSYAELGVRWHLVEGHTRLGYLRAAARADVADKHHTILLFKYGV